MNCSNTVVKTDTYKIDIIRLVVSSKFNKNNCLNLMYASYKRLLKYRTVINRMLMSYNPKYELY